MLIGRDGDHEALLHLLGDGRHGQGGVLVLRGVPGSGASTLLAAVAAAARPDCTVLQARGRDAEASIPWAVVGELLSGLDPPPDDPDGACSAIGLLRLLEARSADRPVCVIVDDAHAADPESVDSLSFCARRVGRRPVIVVLARSVEPCRLDAHDLPERVLAGLGPADLVRLVSSRFDAAPAVIEAVGGMTDGNPAATLEVMAQLRPAQRAGTEPLPDVPFPGAAVLGAFAARLQPLPERTRRALCVAAAEVSGDCALIGPALERLGERLDALEAAEEDGVVAIDGRHVRFDHALRRVAAYHLLAAPSRRAAHRALALAASDPADAPRRVRHLAASVAGTDDAVAADVALLAAYLAGRGQRHEAARAWQLAAALSADPAQRADRSARAARLADRVEESPGLATLSPAERRVALTVGAGLSNKEAAAELFLSVKTVDAHLQAIYRKLSVRSRAELAVVVARSDQEVGR